MPPEALCHRELSSAVQTQQQSSNASRAGGIPWVWRFQDVQQASCACPPHSPGSQSLRHRHGCMPAAPRNADQQRVFIALFSTCRCPRVCGGRQHQAAAVPCFTAVLCASQFWLARQLILTIASWNGQSAAYVCDHQIVDQRTSTCSTHAVRDKGSKHPSLAE